MIEKRDVLFLGYAVNPNSTDDYKGVSVAGNKMQLNILSRLKEDVNLYVITVHPMAPYPTDKVLVYKRQEKQLVNNLISHNVGFINLPIIKQFIQSHNCKKLAEKYIKKHPDAIVLTFNMFPQVGNTAVYLKKKYKSTVATILADPPVDDRDSRGTLSAFLYNRYFDKTKNNYKMTDKVITLNAFARHEYAPQSKFIVMEGGVDASSINKHHTDKPVETHNYELEDGRRHIVYGGSLADYSGIKALVMAMDDVKQDDIILDIYGDGTLKNWVIERQNEHICFHGRVSNDQMLGIMSKAWLLINPRPVDTFMAKTTFPSKIFEYLLSGTPVLSTKLNGFTDDYIDKMFWIEKDDPDGIADAINSVCDCTKGDLEAMANRAYKFVIKEKNWDRQVKRIAKFITA